MELPNAKVCHYRSEIEVTTDQDYDPAKGRWIHHIKGAVTCECGTTTHFDEMTQWAWFHMFCRNPKCARRLTVHVPCPFRSHERYKVRPPELREKLGRPPEVRRRLRRL